MQQYVSDQEIKQALFSMGNEKAPGPDGFTSLFLKKAWHFVKGIVIEAIRSFFISGVLLKEVNSTIISLIPKVPNPTSVSDFRPIACCDVIYKCITKILANRFQKNLDSLVSLNQIVAKNGMIQMQSSTNTTSARLSICLILRCLHN